MPTAQSLKKELDSSERCQNDKTKTAGTSAKREKEIRKMSEEYRDKLRTRNIEKETEILRTKVETCKTTLETQKRF